MKGTLEDDVTEGKFDLRMFATLHIGVACLLSYLTGLRTPKRNKELVANRDFAYLL